MKHQLPMKPLRYLLMALCLFAVTADVMASYTPSKYSTTWTTSNHVYLYNKATGLYLATGGHWGTEGMLKATGLPVYMGSDHSTKGDATDIAMYSKQDQSKRWGLITSAESFDPIKDGFFCDAGDSYPAQTFGFKYNSDDDTYSIYREGVTANNIAIKYTSNDTTYYLAPKVGDITTLIWSTEPYFWAYEYNSTTGNYNAYAVSGSSKDGIGTKYYLYHEANDKLQVSTSASNGSRQIYFDGDYIRFGMGYYLEYSKSDFPMSTSRPSAAAIAKVYPTTGNNVYLTQQGTNDARKNIVTELVCDEENIPDIARWYVVTMQDMIDDFESATASTSQPKEASFYLANADLSRNISLGWKLTDDDLTRGWNKPYTRFGDALYNIDGPTHSTGYIDGVAQNTNVESSDGTVNTTTASYTDNGSGYQVTSDDVKYAGVAAGSTTYYHAIYGGYYNVRMLSNGTSTSRKMYQRISGLKAGYYKFSCDGYVYNPSGANGTAQLYAERIYGENSEIGAREKSSAELPEVSTYQTMTQAGITFYNNGKASDYRNSVIVYVATDTTTVEFGVKVQDGTFSNAAQGNANTFAEIDGFKLEYTGNPTYDILLNENGDSNEEYTDDDNNSYNYINAQVYDGARTLYLFRAMNVNKWNSLVLPVNINAGSLKTAFGDNVKLVEFHDCTGNTINFTTVNIDDDATTAIEAGKCYLIKPSTLNCKTSGNYKVTLAKCPKESINTNATENRPVFVINQVTLDKEISTPTSSNVFKPTYDASETGLQFEGTYFYTSGAIAPGSYAINAADGNWYRWTGSKNLNVSGFRAWIGVAPSSSPSKLTMVINGEQMEPTDIAGITTEQPVMQNSNVYSINGQLMGNAQNVNKLPKGLYILNGKKFIVK